ncbi:MAG TPA: hypothetical protein VG457_09395 [Planctomycetota bacterium]|jgi:hypothetical protein|nr:hypothetical protein [Planctomycetota bacterium]
MNDVESRPASAMAQKLRQRFWGRLRGLKIIRESDLIRVHRHAQQRGIAPEAAIVALGMLTEDQVIAILTGERPVLASA